VLLAQVRTGHWCSIFPERFIVSFALPENVLAIPLVEPAASYTIGLIVPQREPMSPLTAALVAEGRKLAPGLLGGETAPATIENIYRSTSHPH
jgi:hypothetical protein